MKNGLLRTAGSVCLVSLVSGVGLALAGTPAYGDDEGSGKKAKGQSAPAEARGAIERHIHAHQQEGAFAIYDPRQGQALALEPVKIHESAHRVASGHVYYCADFRGSDGTLYDLDFYVDDREGRPAVVETLIHKRGKGDRVRPAAQAKAVEGAVAESVRQTITQAWQGGQALVDPRTGKTLNLDFDYVHESVKPVANGAYFACVDARDQGGTLYDLDTYVVSDGSGGFEVAEVLIHKKGGEERLRSK